MFARLRVASGLRGAFASLALLLLSAAAAAPAGNPRPAEYLQAVEFPYYLYPRTLWERELVWLKNIGIRSVEFSIPWNWHQLAPGDFDFTGRTSPRRDLHGLIRILRRLGLNAWVRPLPPVDGWRNLGSPPNADAAAQRAWLKQLSDILTTQTASHGGPVAWVEGAALEIDAAAPPAAMRISAADPAALALSREALAAGKNVLWTGVEDRLYPAGWKSDNGALRVEGFVDWVKAGKESYYIVSKFEHFEYAKVAPLFAQLSNRFEQCVYGLNLVKNELEVMQHPIARRTNELIM